MSARKGDSYHDFRHGLLDIVASVGAKGGLAHAVRSDEETSNANIDCLLAIAYGS